MNPKYRSWVWTGSALLMVSLISLFLRLDFDNAQIVLLELRLPRLWLAIAIGGSLAMSGAVLQTVLGNPLAEPYTLGVASGAALGAAVGSSLGWASGLGGIHGGLHVGGALGAAAVVGVLFRLTRNQQTGSDSIILVGVMISLAAASLLAIWMALADPAGVQSINFWLLGDLSRMSMIPAMMLFLFSVVVFAYFMKFSRNLDAFLLGLDGVPSFGVSPMATLKASVLLVSILVGFCVSAAGVIGFLGLIVPHLVRKRMGTSIHRRVLPMIYVWGAIVLVLSDALARAVGYPHELPVGAVTALVGAPAFILLYRRQRHEVRA
jgi:iron complex transport system permease protein